MASRWVATEHAARRCSADRRRLLALTAGSLAGLASAPATADAVIPATSAATSAAASATPPTLTTDLVRNGLYVITGGGSNALLRFSAQGSLLVDGKLPGNYRPLMAQVRRTSRLSDLPVRVLVLTNHHQRHSGTNPQFLAAGIPLLVHAKGRRHVTIEPPAEGKPMPTLITFDRHHPLRFGGVAVDLLHFGSAHTDNDTVVHFSDLKVVAVGDLFTRAAPVPDYTGGGSLTGWPKVIAKVLELDFDLVVPSEGPVIGRAELQSFKSRLDTLIQRATALIDSGVTQGELRARLQVDDLGWQLDAGSMQLDQLYADLSRGR